MTNFWVFLSLTNILKLPCCQNTLMSFTNIAFTAASLPFFFLYVCGCLFVSPQPVIPLQGAKHNSCVLLRKTNPAPDSQLWYKSNLTPSEILHLQMHPSKERKNESQQSNIKISTLKWKLEASDVDSSNNTKNSTVEGKLVWRTKRLWNIRISWLGYILKCNTNVGFIPLEGCLHYLVFTPPRFLYHRFCTISFPTYSYCLWFCQEEKDSQDTTCIKTISLMIEKKLVLPPVNEPIVEKQRQSWNPQVFKLYLCMRFNEIQCLGILS